VDNIAAINRIAQPVRPLGPGEVHTKAIYLVSDAVNAFGGAVPANELARMAELCINAPVLVGHQKQSLPVGRTFRAELVSVGDRQWLKVWFYWRRDGGAGDKLRADIDAGIVREASVSFIFDRPECTVCHEDYRTCGHDRQDGTGARFHYGGVRQVLEVSLVYRGAVEGTRIVDAKAPTSVATPAPTQQKYKLWLVHGAGDTVGYFAVGHGRRWRHWTISQLSLPHLRRGARFVARETCIPHASAQRPALDSGAATVETTPRGHLLVRCAGALLRGTLIIRPSRLNGVDWIYLQTEQAENEAGETNE
jgi:hypothetical protein